MPFGKKPGAAGMMIDFDAVYRDIIAVAIEDAGLEPLRADEEMAGGIIHKPMFERLVLCEYAVADLSTANANVFYELGVRHAVRPFTTVLLFSKGTGQLPFDVAPLRAMPYQLSSDGKPDNISHDLNALKDRLVEAKRSSMKDSPVYQLLEDFPDIDHTKTDVFRERVRYSADLKQRLADAREKGIDAVRTLENEFGDIGSSESGPVVDLFLSYRAVKAWPDMIRLVKAMSAPLSHTVMIQEQLALALNRDGRSKEAERVLLELIENRGPSSETYGILGRVYKDRWEASDKQGEKMAAASYLEKAVDAYKKGFEADFRDAYPGINAVTLMELKEPPDAERVNLLPVVAYAVERKIALGKPDYWDFATRLEIAVLAKDENKAMAALGNCLTSIREVWEPETTIRNLRLIREARERRKDPVPWALPIENELEKKTVK